MASIAVAITLAACGGSSSSPTDAAPGAADAHVGPDAAPGPDAGPTPDGGVGPHPFGTHGGYVTTGVIFPANHDQAALDAATAAFYDAWKQRYLVAGCVSGEYRVKSAPDTADFTVSEAHGYGMLIAVIMDGHDPDAHAIFDGLYHYYAGHPSAANPPLMAWAQNQACANVDGPDSATDGDLDIAYALLLADREWGSAGAVDYHTAATALIAAILAAEIHPANSILVGDWATAGDAHRDGTRPSDFMTGHLRAYGAATGTARWTTVLDHTYALVDYLQVHAAPTTGLLPDFAIGAAGATPSPAPANWLEGADDGRYAYNACRVPWRLAADFLMNGDARAQVAVRKIEAWARTRTADKPTALRDGYALDGTVTGSSAELAFVAPIAVGAMIQPATGSNQAWLDALWDEVAQRAPGQYYGDSIKLLAMITMSGNWWTP
jgi:endo-1,4-beta-D-glucanase Y